MEEKGKKDFVFNCLVWLTQKNTQNIFWEKKSYFFLCTVDTDTVKYEKPF